MPNKEKSVKSMPKTSGKLDSIYNVSKRTDSTADTITTDIQKNNSNKKKEKVKNKLTKNTNNCNGPITTEEIVENGSNVETIDNDEIRAVSEELLRRLQLNGTSVSICKPSNEVKNTSDITNQSQSKASKQNNYGANGSKDQTKRQQRQINNNNSSKLHNKNNHNQCQSPLNVNISSDDTCSYGDPSVRCNGLHTDSKSENAENIDSNESTLNLQSTPSESTSSYEPSTSNPANEVGQSLSSMQSALSIKSIKTDTVEITFKEYENELQMPDIMRVIQRELSEPYSIYTYRYFIHNWPKLCFLAMDGDNCIGAIVCKLDIHRQMTKRGYIAMLAVDAAYRKLKVGTTLVQKAIEVRLIML